MAYQIHCEKCGHEFEAEKWNPGMACEKCNATDTIPKTKIGGSPPPPQRARDQEAARKDWKHNPVVAVAAIVLILGVWGLMGYKKFKKPVRMKVEVVTVCTECQTEGKNFRGEIPAECPKCKTKTMLSLYLCSGDGEKECGYRFPFYAPRMPKAMSLDTSKLSPEEQQEHMQSMDKAMMEHEQAQMEAMKCPKCRTFNTGPVYTEEQKKKFEELRAKYSKKKKKKKK